MPRKIHSAAAASAMGSAAASVPRRTQAEASLDRAFDKTKLFLLRGYRQEADLGMAKRWCTILTTAVANPGLGRNPGYSPIPVILQLHGFVDWAIEHGEWDLVLPLKTAELPDHVAADDFVQPFVADAIKKAEAAKQKEPVMPLDLGIELLLRKPAVVDLTQAAKAAPGADGPVRTVSKRKLPSAGAQRAPLSPMKRALNGAQLRVSAAAAAADRQEQPVQSKKPKQSFMMQRFLRS